MSKEEGEYEEEEQQPMGTKSRGFSGATKFSEFRKTVNTTNPANSSSDTKESKDTKPVTKSRGLGEDDDVYAFTKQSNDYYEAREGEVEIIVDDEMKDEHGILEKVSEKISTVKQDIKAFAHDITYEVRDFYERSIKGERDSWA